jgi:hypothetical protein
MLRNIIYKQDYTARLHRYTRNLLLIIEDTRNLSLGRESRKFSKLLKIEIALACARDKI